MFDNTIAAIKMERFIFMRTEYRCAQSVSMTRPKLPLKEEVYSEQNRGWRLRLQPFRGEDRFRIGAGNLAHRNPAEATNQRAD
jgi:hypothetical protein